MCQGSYMINAQRLKYWRPIDQEAIFWRVMVLDHSRFMETSSQWVFRRTFEAWFERFLTRMRTSKRSIQYPVSSRWCVLIHHSQNQNTDNIWQANSGPNTNGCQVSKHAVLQCWLIQASIVFHYYGKMRLPGWKARCLWKSHRRYVDIEKNRECGHRSQ